MTDSSFAGLVKRAVAAVPPLWNPLVGTPLLCEQHRKAWHRLLLTWEDDPGQLGARREFARGDIVLDSRCGVVTYGVVIAVHGRSVYYIDGCGPCRGGRHHRCNGAATSTHKGRGRVRTNSLREIGSEW